MQHHLTGNKRSALSHGMQGVAAPLPVQADTGIDTIAMASQANLSWRERAEQMRARRQQAPP